MHTIAYLRSNSKSSFILLYVMYSGCVSNAVYTYLYYRSWLRDNLQEMSISAFLNKVKFKQKIWKILLILMLPCENCLKQTRFGNKHHLISSLCSCLQSDFYLHCESACDTVISRYQLQKYYVSQMILKFAVVHIIAAHFEIVSRSLLRPDIFYIVSLMKKVCNTFHLI